jgi:hypothetical protein
MKDWMSEAAREKFNLPEEWRWAQSEAIPGGFLLKGNTTTEKKKRDGTFKTVWKRPLDKYIITKEDTQQCEKNYEKSTGNCAYCEGTGKHCCGWNKDTGSEYETCSKCTGTGRSLI